MNAAARSQGTGLRERKKVQTRTEIRRHALRLFTEQGFAETSLDHIAEAANVSPRTVIRYFQTKDSIALGECVDHGLASAIRRQPLGQGLIDAMKAAVDETCGRMTQSGSEEDRARQALIISTPELAMTLARTAKSDLFDALQERSNEDEAYLRLLSGAVIGVLLGADYDGQTLDNNYAARVQMGLAFLAHGFRR
jgi:AcrR family transcriptional regulator